MNATNETTASAKAPMAIRWNKVGNGYEIATPLVVVRIEPRGFRFRHFEMYFDGALVGPRGTLKAAKLTLETRFLNFVASGEKTAAQKLTECVAKKGAL